MDIGGEHIETDAPPQGIGRAVFGKRLHEHQKRADGIVSREQRRENFPQPQAEARAEDRAALLQTGRNVQHGVFEHGHKEREHVQAHDQHQPAKAEKALRPRARRRKQLLEQALFLHEQDPAHRRDIRRRHERDHEDDIQPAVLFELRAREKKGRRHSDDGRAQHDAHAEQQRIADRLHVFRAGNGPPRLIQVKAAIDDDRLGKNCDQGTENEAGQKRQQEKPWEIFLKLLVLIAPPYLLAEAVELRRGVGGDLHHLHPVRRDLRNVGEVGTAVALDIAAAGQQVSVGHELLRLIREQEVDECLGIRHIGAVLRIMAGRGFTTVPEAG